MIIINHGDEGYKELVEHFIRMIETIDLSIVNTGGVVRLAEHRVSFMTKDLAWMGPENSHLMVGDGIENRNKWLTVFPATSDGATVNLCLSDNDVLRVDAATNSMYKLWFAGQQDKQREVLTRGSQERARVDAEFLKSLLNKIARDGADYVEKAVDEGRIVIEDIPPEKTRNTSAGMEQ